MLVLRDQRIGAVEPGRVFVVALRIKGRELREEFVFLVVGPLAGRQMSVEQVPADGRTNPGDQIGIRVEGWIREE